MRPVPRPPARPKSRPTIRSRPNALGTLAAMLAVGATLLAAPTTADAQAARKPPAARAAVAKKPVQPPAPALPPIDDATPEQLDAAERVYYGHYACEFDQSITLHSSPKHLAYVDLTHGKNAYLMKPVLSSTGAIRLEDVRGATLMVQIANKSMLLDVQAGRRLVDECVSPKQRELIEAARQAKAAAATAPTGEPAPAPLLSGPSAEPMKTPPTPSSAGALSAK